MLIGNYIVNFNGEAEAAFQHLETAAAYVIRFYINALDDVTVTAHGNETDAAAFLIIAAAALIDGADYKIVRDALNYVLDGGECFDVLDDLIILEAYF